MWHSFQRKGEKGEGDSDSRGEVWGRKIKKRERHTERRGPERERHRQRETRERQRQRKERDTETQKTDKERKTKRQREGREKGRESRGCDFVLAVPGMWGRRPTLFDKTLQNPGRGVADLPFSTKPFRTRTLPRRPATVGPLKEERSVGRGSTSRVGRVGRVRDDADQRLERHRSRHNRTQSRPGRVDLTPSVRPGTPQSPDDRGSTPLLRDLCEEERARGRQGRRSVNDERGL